MDLYPLFLQTNNRNSAPQNPRISTPARWNKSNTTKHKSGFFRMSLFYCRITHHYWSWLDWSPKWWALTFFPFSVNTECVPHWVSSSRWKPGEAVYLRKLNFKRQPTHMHADTLGLGLFVYVCVWWKVWIPQAHPGNTNKHTTAHACQLMEMLMMHFKRDV